MLKRIFMTCLVAAFAVNLGHALDNRTSKIIIPVGKTSPADGKQMFTSYCAPCHGVDGRGHGPAASALRVPPTDLSNLTTANGGKFPVSPLLSVLRFGVDHPAHGSAEMPVWGPIFAKMNQVAVVEREQRTTNLIEYLRTLQSK
jgi:mono/diheme cytochrome c family protein